MALQCQVTNDKLFRYLFYVLNCAILALTVVFFIMGFVKFEKYNGVYLGSFIGGWITSVSAFYFCIGAIGILGTVYNYTPLLGIYMGINAISFIIRILTIALFTIKKYGVHWSSYAVGFAEVLMSLICLTIIQVIIEKSPRNRNATSKRETTISTVSSLSRDRKSAKTAEEGSNDYSAVYGNASSSSGTDKYNNF